METITKEDFVDSTIRQIKDRILEELKIRNTSIPVRYIKYQNFREEYHEVVKEIDEKYLLYCVNYLFYDGLYWNSYDLCNRTMS